MVETNANQKPNSVGLVGDGDDVELIECFEEVFAITFSNEEVERITTLGEAYEIICSKLPTSTEKKNSCLTAMAYNRLNRALRDQGRIPLAVRIDVPSNLTPKNFQKQLEERSNLRLDFLTRASSWAVALNFLQFVTWVAGLILFSGLSAFVATGVIFVVSHALWRIAERTDSRVWSFDGTIGDLSRRASEENIGKLVLLGGKWKDADIWQSMTSIISDFTGYPCHKMTPETVFI